MRLVCAQGENWLHCAVAECFWR